MQAKVHRWPPKAKSCCFGLLLDIGESKEEGFTVKGSKTQILSVPENQEA